VPWWGRWWRGRGRGWGWQGWGAPPAQAGVWPAQQAGTTLASVPPGSRVVVKSILAGWGATSRLAGLGIAPGVELEVVSNDIAYPWTPVVVRVSGVEVAIGRGIASRIIVEPVGRAAAEAAPAPSSQGGGQG